MIDGPTRRPAVLARNRQLSREQQPPSWRLGIDLIPSKKVGMLGKKLLKLVLRGETGWGHWHHLAPIQDHEYSGHEFPRA